ncbi:RpiB/LacA/LacB family sugar-phosphate isomerase [Anaerotruncus colihominis]|uniref:RpiB/LacA/LacB family sugar-phosphate isomerase n=1 Tax=Anaerotruncus colihominis TaxID=169435 RepID=UPI0018992B43|nr:RpiB/LacA/LacB family sugar-phosphate isomerase [Anaerotruncus colihominis]
MKIAIGCDQNALELKEQLKAFIMELGHVCVDFGGDEPIYANTAIRLAQAVAAGECDRGVLICGTGIGMCIAANKVKGAYAALVNNVYQAQRAQLSNRANIMTLGAQVTGVELAKCLVQSYLKEQFDPQSRSAPKVQRICDYENGR